jgi:hypothetical protein
MMLQRVEADLKEDIIQAPVDVTGPWQGWRRSSIALNQ